MIDGTKDQGPDDDPSGIRPDRMSRENEPPLGWDENRGEIVLYASLEDAIAAVKEPLIIHPEFPSMNPDDISDMGEYVWMEKLVR